MPTLSNRKYSDDKPVLYHFFVLNTKNTSYFCFGNINMASTYNVICQHMSASAKSCRPGRTVWFGTICLSIENKRREKSCIFPCKICKKGLSHNVRQSVNMPCWCWFSLHQHYDAIWRHNYFCRQSRQLLRPIPTEGGCCKKIHFATPP